MNRLPHLVEEIADWAVEIQSTELPNALGVHLRRGLLDHATAVIAGSQAPVVVAVKKRTVESGLDGPASVAGSVATASADAAALVNGTAAHALRIDDGYTPGAVHPGAAVTPAVLAVAERAGLGGKRFLTALAIGVEIACRLGAAADREALRRGRPAAGVPEAVGAAVGAVSALGGDRVAVAAAIAIAASRVGDRSRHDDLSGGAGGSRLGVAAWAGVTSADQALECGERPGGDRGQPSPLAFERERFDHAVALDALGERWDALRTYLKPYPCSRHLHGPIELVLELTDHARVDLDSVESATVVTYETAARHGAANPAGATGSQTGIPYAVAVALRDGAVHLGQLGERSGSDPALRSLCERVEVSSDEKLTERYPRERPAELRLTFRSGTSLRAALTAPYGEPDHPLSTTDLLTKFEALCGPLIGAAQRHRIATMIAQAFSVSEFASALRFEAPAAAVGPSPAPAA